MTSPSPSQVQINEPLTPIRTGDAHDKHIPMGKLRTGLIITLFGLFVFLLGVRPALFDMDRSSVIGFVQIAVMLIGLAIVCLGGYTTLAALWNSTPRSIAADIGLRLVSTGYVIAVFAGMADVFGIGSHRFPILPYFGHLQALGVEFGQATIAIGFILLLPVWKKRRK